jgi:hypothetical protein
MRWKRLRRRWLQGRYKHALNCLLVREHIETFPGVWLGLPHPLLRRRSLMKMADKVGRLWHACMVLGCGTPPECEETWWAIRRARRMRCENRG